MPLPGSGIGLRTHRLAAALLVFLAFGFVLFLGLKLMLSPFLTEAQNLSHSLPLYERKAAALASSVRTWYSALPPDLRALFPRQDAGGQGFSPGMWLRTVLEAALAGTIVGLQKIVDLLLIPVLAFYFVLDGHALRNEFLVLVPRSRLREAFALLRESSAIMRTYMIAQLWLCVIAGIVVYLGLLLLRMHYALILGLLAGVTRAIPIIGPVIGGIPIVVLALVMPNGGLLLALKVFVFFSSLHLIESKLIMPKFIGHRIHLHAALVIIVLLVGYEFFGLLGMFLAAPVAAIGRILIAHYLIGPRRLAARSAASRVQPPLVIKTN